jgi:hypothetical protein
VEQEGETKEWGGMGLNPNKTNLPNNHPPHMMGEGEGGGGCPDDVSPHLDPLPPRGEEVLGIKEGGLRCIETLFRKNMGW